MQDDAADFLQDLGRRSLVCPYASEASGRDTDLVSLGSVFATETVRPIVETGPRRQRTPCRASNPGIDIISRAKE